MASTLSRLLVAVIILAPQGLQAQHAPPENLVSGWPTLVDGIRDTGNTLLGSHPSIEVSFFMSNDASSPDSVTLEAGFFPQIDLALVDETGSRVVAAVSQWRETGSCPGQPGCSLDSDIVLSPGYGATFAAVLSTLDGQPLADGQYILRVVLGTARQRIRMPNGSPWSGRLGAEGRIPVTVRPVRDATDLRQLDILRANAAVRRNDHAAALAIHQRMIARDPMDAAAHGWAGLALMHLRRLPEAAAAFDRSLEIDPSAEVLAPTIATVYFAVGEDAKAVALLRRHYPSPDRFQAVEREARQGAVRLRGLP